MQFAARLSYRSVQGTRSDEALVHGPSLTGTEEEILRKLGLGLRIGPSLSSSDSGKSLGAAADPAAAGPSSSSVGERASSGGGDGVPATPERKPKSILKTPTPKKKRASARQRTAPSVHFDESVNVTTFLVDDPGEPADRDAIEGQAGPVDDAETTPVAASLSSPSAGPSFLAASNST